MFAKAQNLSSYLVKVFMFISFILIPFVMSSQTSEIFEINKIVFLYLLVGISLFFWALKYFFSKSIILQIHPLMAGYILFILTLIPGVYFSIEPISSFFGVYGRVNGGLLSYIIYGMLMFLLVQFFKNNDYSKKLVWGLIWVSVLVVVWGLTGWIGYDASCRLFVGAWTNTCWGDAFRPSERMFSTLGQPNWLAGALLAFVFYPLGVVLQKNYSIIWRVVNLLIFSILSFGIYATKSKTAYLGLLILGICYILLKVSRSSLLSQTLRKIIIYLVPSILVFGILISIFWTIFAKFDLPSENTPVNKITDSLMIRSLTWRGAIDIWKKYPFIGSGLETFGASYQNVRNIAHNYTSEWDYTYNKAHNEYLNFLAGGGIIALFGYLVFIFWSLKILVDKVIFEFNEYSVGALLGYLSILWMMNTGFSIVYTNVLLILFVCSSLNFSKVKTIYFTRGFSKIPLVFAMIIASLVVLHALMFLSGDKKYAQSLGGVSFESARKSIGAQELYPHFLIRENTADILVRLLSAQSDTQETENESIIKIVLSQMQKVRKDAPNNPSILKSQLKNYYLLYLNSMDNRYLKTGNEIYEKLLILSPNDPRIPYLWSMFLNAQWTFAQDKKEKSRLKEMELYQIEKALKLKKNWIEAKVVLSEIKKDQGRIAQALEIIQELRTLAPNNEELQSKEIELMQYKSKFKN